MSILTSCGASDKFHTNAVLVIVSVIKNPVFNVFAISCAMFLRMLGVFMALPVMAYGAEGLPGSTTLLIGIAIGIHGLSQATLQIPFGYLSDVWRRKYALLLGMLLFFIGSLVAAFSINIWMLILGRFLQGCGAVGSVSLAFILDKVQNNRQSLAVAVFGMSIGAAFIVSLFLGPILYTKYSLQGLFYIGAVLALISISLIAIVPDNDTSEAKIFDSNIYLSIRETFTLGPRLPISFLVVFLIHAALANYFALLPHLVGVVNYKGYLYPVLIAAVVMIASPMKDRPMETVFLSLLAMASAQILSVFGVGRLSFCIFLISFIILETALPSIVSQNCKAGQRGISLGIYATFQFLGVFLGGSISGFMLNYLDARVIPLLASFVTFGVLVVILLYTKTKGEYTVLVER